MIDRGLDRSLRRGGRARGARGERRGVPRAATCATCRRSRSTPRAHATSTTRSRRSAPPGGAIRVWVHIADVAAFVTPGSLVDREAQRRATSVYVPGGGRADAAGGAVQRAAARCVPGEDRLAVTVELELDGARVVRAAFTRSLIRSDERLDYDRVGPHLRGRASARRSRGRTRWTAAREAAAGARRARACVAAALEIAGSEPEFSFDALGPRALGARGRADRVPPPDRAPDDRRQRAGRTAARGPRRARALPRARGARSPERVERLVAAAGLARASRRRRSPTASTPSQAGELVGAISQAVERYVALERTRAPRVRAR